MSNQAEMEILQSARALDDVIELSKLYLSGAPLPSVEEIQGIYKQANDKLRHGANNL